jgi:CO/xanthine dehydrogenase Mo-binding subunit
MAYRVIGGGQARPDAWEKVRGRPIYAGDFPLPGMLHGRIVRSPYASARIARLDTRGARALPGRRTFTPAATCSGAGTCGPATSRKASRART